MLWALEIRHIRCDYGGTLTASLVAAKLSQAALITKLESELDKGGVSKSGRRNNNNNVRKDRMTEQTVGAEQQADQQTAWVREQYQKATKFLAEKGIVPGKVTLKDSRVLPPLVAVWKIEETGPQKRKFWVLSGDLPTDVLPESAAPDARAVVRHFSLAWQLKAENLLRSSDETQYNFGRLLVGRAEGLGKLHNDERAWKGMPVKV